jgi:predicted Zn-dependent protease
MAHVRKKQYGPAVTSLEECVKRLPNNTTYIKYLADAYAAAGRRDDAISTIDRVIQKHPDDENAKKMRAAINSLPEKKSN